MMKYNQFSDCLVAYRVDLDKAETQAVFNFFDKHKSGAVNYEAFLKGVRVIY